MVAAIRSWAQRLFGMRSPVRPIEVYRLRIFAAGFASLGSTLVFLLTYYGTLALLPSTHVDYSGFRPYPAWQNRLDLAQFVGIFADPPYPNHLTWIVGVVALAAILFGSGVLYALLCSWGMTIPRQWTGAMFGGAVFFGLASFVSLGSGFNPGVMRQTLPDVGFFFLGWSGWAAAQLFVCSLLYGLCLSFLYRAWISIDK